MTDFLECSPPAAITCPGVQGHVDVFGPNVIDGWVTIAANPRPKVHIDLRVNGEVVGHITADIWRGDLAESRQGDGRWGFTALPPAALADGNEHLVTLTLRDGSALLAGPIRARFDAGADRAALPQMRPPVYEPVPPSASRPAPAPQAGTGETLVSFIVVFHNMGREAARTLASLQPAYQRGAGGIGYEVICIDNGSIMPLDPGWVEGFGAEFRLIRADHPSPSPVALMNAAARTARGHHVALMIDGAHILSPGVVREVADAIAEAPRAVIGLRQWFIGGDQRFLAQGGWTRSLEDMLFDRIAWPQDGYDLFRIGSPVWESPNCWFDAMSESNCLFVPASIFAAIGGFDEAFDEPGAGYANLDLFRRAVEATDEPPVALIGEASFHQFHGGVTTNVGDAEKDRRVRAFAHKYARLRAKPWAPIEPGAIRLRGQVRTRSAIFVRQRPLSPARIGVTTQVRTAELTTHFDDMACDYLTSVYVEAGLDQRATWRGQAVGVAPTDAMEIAAILHDLQPTHVVAVNAAPGLVTLVRDVCGAAGRGHLVLVGDDGGAGADALAPDTLRGVSRALAAATDVVVLFAMRPGEPRLLDALCAYGAFVSLRSYLVVLGSGHGQPWLGYATAWPQKALNSFVSMQPFAIDHSRTAHLLTTCPLGFLQRIGPIASGDERLDAA